MRTNKSGTTSNKNIAFKCHINKVYHDNQITNQYLLKLNDKNLSLIKRLSPLVFSSQYLNLDHSKQ